MARFTVSAGCGTAKWNDLLFPQVAERPNDVIYRLPQRGKDCFYQVVI
jgi:hypothetical protein